MTNLVEGFIGVGSSRCSPLLEILGAFIKTQQNLIYLLSKLILKKSSVESVEAIITPARIIGVDS